MKEFIARLEGKSFYGLKINEQKVNLANQIGERGGFLFVCNWHGFSIKESGEY